MKKLFFALAIFAMMPLLYAQQTVKINPSLDFFGICDGNVNSIRPLAIGFGKSYYAEEEAKKKKRRKKRKGKSGGGFGMGPEFAGIKFLGAGLSFAPGIGVRAFFSKDGENSFNAGVAMFFPKSYTYTITGNALSSLTVPQSKEFTEKISSKATQIIGGYTRYFTGGFGEDFSFYGGANAGIMFYSYKGKISESTAGYDVGSGDSKGTVTGFQIRGALGIEKDLGFAHLYTELEGDLPANNVGGVIVDINIPFFIGLRAGLRFHF